MAAMNANDVGIDVDEIMMRTSSFDHVSMKTSYSHQRAGSRIEATLSEHGKAKRWPSSRIATMFERASREERERSHDVRKRKNSILSNGSHPRKAYRKSNSSVVAQKKPSSTGNSRHSTSRSVSSVSSKSNKSKTIKKNNQRTPFPDRP